MMMKISTHWLRRFVLVAAALTAASVYAEPSWKAHWIWLDNSGPQMNLLAQARREFQLDSPQSGVIRITADSRYRLYVNGEWIGDGISGKDRLIHLRWDGRQGKADEENDAEYLGNDLQKCPVGFIGAAPHVHTRKIQRLN
ncbi:MAG: hypothetical protein ACP5I1_15915 [Candidatus Hinthialibacter sp.]